MCFLNASYMGDIEEGKYYAVDYYEDGGIKETAICLILLTDEETPRFHSKTETMWLKNTVFQHFYSSYWITDYFEREATLEEISYFKKMRRKFGKRV
ncbi:hypothetical protein ABD87_14930 [Lysinibacillus sphaericus]|uniref:hypothetical protein n=1 Tax=Lysinibacillus sphaericus TaxID=1421 RepID=UPI0018CCCF8E|nr:hypothetical protein [Lysinibacillus sphaericus]MBG9730788.1 hypothetical protein [Lysinibacillus sphaericus]